VVVYEKSDRIGGLMRYGIPDFKLEKEVLDRRIEQMTAEGVVFEPGIEAGKDITVAGLNRASDAILIATGSGVPRDLSVKGRELAGIYFAIDYLKQQNQAGYRQEKKQAAQVSARGKEVVVIGGGDTGSDCVGTAIRQGAKSVSQIELLPRPPIDRPRDNPWPTWPNVMRTSSSQQEGCRRLWSSSTLEFQGQQGKLAGLCCTKLSWSRQTSGRWQAERVKGGDFLLKAELVLLAMGFLHTEHGPLIRGLGLRLDPQGNIKTDRSLVSSRRGVFAAGDAASGQSLVVRAMEQGRRVALIVDDYLSG
jgi:glutamate synthase (NADPH/NADH) small chain